MSHIFEHKSDRDVLARSDPPSADSESTAEDANPAFEDRTLRAVLEIDRSGPCLMDSVADKIVDVDVRLEGGRCNVDVSMLDCEDEDESTCTKHFSNRICDYCPGAVFSEYGCLPRYCEVRERGFSMETYLADTKTVAELVEDLRSVCDRVTLRSLVSTDRADCEEICSVDLSVLTPKQSEAINLAQQAGYYNSDSSVSLEELADQIGISTSALSQRLKRGEGNVLRQLSCRR